MQGAASDRVDAPASGHGSSNGTSGSGFISSAPRPHGVLAALQFSGSAPREARRSGTPPPPPWPRSASPVVVGEQPQPAATGTLPQPPRQAAAGTHERAGGTHQHQQRGGVIAAIGVGTFSVLSWAEAQQAAAADEGCVLIAAAPVANPEALVRSDIEWWWPQLISTDPEPDAAPAAADVPAQPEHAEPLGPHELWEACCAGAGSDASSSKRGVTPKAADMQQPRPAGVQQQRMKAASAGGRRAPAGGLSRSKSKSKSSSSRSGSGSTGQGTLSHPQLPPPPRLQVPQLPTTPSWVWGVPARSSSATWLPPLPPLQQQQQYTFPGPPAIMVQLPEAAVQRAPWPWLITGACMGQGTALMLPPQLQPRLPVPSEAVGPTDVQRAPWRMCTTGARMGQGTGLTPSPQQQLHHYQVQQAMLSPHSQLGPCTPNQPHHRNHQSWGYGGPSPTAAAPSPPAWSGWGRDPGSSPMTSGTSSSLTSPAGPSQQQQQQQSGDSLVTVMMPELDASGYGARA